MENLSADQVNKTFNTALNALMRGQLDEAKTGFETVIKNNPQAPEAFLNLGNVYFMQNQLDEAIKNFEQAIQLDPTLKKAYMNLGSCYFKKDSFDYAIGYWTVATNLDPQNALVHQNIAVAYEKIGNMQKAFKHYEAFLRFNTSNSKTASQIKRKVDECKRVAYHNLNAGITFHKRQKWADALTAYTKSIETYPNFPKAHLNLGSIYYKNERIDEAITNWENALKLEPDHANTHCNLAIAYDRKQIFNEACYHYMKYLELTFGKTHDAPQVKSRVDELHKILNEKRELLRQHLNKGNDLFNNKQYEAAIEEFRKYLVLNPNGVDTKSVNDRIQEAQVRLNPVDKAMEVAFRMGNEFFEAALYDKAIAAYNRYLNLNPSGPKSAEIKTRLDMCHKQIGNVVSAMLKSD